MRKTGTVIFIGLLMTALFTGFNAGEKVREAPQIQMAILLDTSGSMSGLIDQAKTQLWSIVNEFATVKRAGQRPELRVALYEYGKSSIPASEGYIRMILPLTTDLDKVSQELFALKTNGGDEYCGQVIQSGTQGLSWSSSKNDYKVIFIAGNEPFTQGNVDYRQSCRAAISKGIIVNTIFCGNFEEGVRTHWKDGALLADGSYMHIEQNRQAVYIEAPQDKEIVELGVELNKTYIPYGDKGVAGAANQSAQDMNAAAAAPKTMAQRAVSKASQNYRNAFWDLVDAVAEGQVKLDEVKDEDLPEKMKKMNQEERRAYVSGKAKERKEVQTKIQKLNDARKKYVAEEMKKRSDKGEDTLEAVIIQTVRRQAEKKNYKFD